jgi:hypothetical protein
MLSQEEREQRVNHLAAGIIEQANNAQSDDSFWQVSPRRRQSVSPPSFRSKFIGSLHFRSEFNTSTVPCCVRLASQNPTRPPTEVGDYKDKAC